MSNESSYCESLYHIPYDTFSFFKACNCVSIMKEKIGKLSHGGGGGGGVVGGWARHLKLQSDPKLNKTEICSKQL